MASLLPLLNNPTAQAIAMASVKELISSLLTGKKSNKDKQEAIDELKKKLDSVINDKNEAIKTIIENKNEKLRKSAECNVALLEQVHDLQMRMGAQENVNSLSEDLLRERQAMLDKINALETEIENARIVKETKEQETVDIQRKFEEQKKDNKELIDLVNVLTKLGNTVEETSASTAADKVAPTSTAGDEMEVIFSKLLTLLEKKEINPEPPQPTKKKNKIKNKNVSDNLLKQNNQQTNPFLSGSNTVNMSAQHGQDYHPGMAGPSRMNYNTMHGSNVGPYPNMGTYPNMGNTGGPPPFSHMQGPYLHNNQQLVGPPLQMGMSPTQYVPQNFHTAPPLMNISPGFLPAQAPSNYYPNQKGSSFQRNINAPNNFDYNKNKTNNNKKCNEDKSTDKNQQEYDSKKSASDKEKTDKSDPPADLWERLDKLKEDIKRNKSSKSYLLSQIPMLMSDVAKSSIPSKDKFLSELSESVKLIHDLPDRSSNSNEWNRGRRGSRGWKQGGSHYQRRQSEGHNIKNSDENDSDTSCATSVKSERGSAFRGRGGRSRGWKQGGWHHERRQAGDSNKNSDDNDSDGAISVKSERGKGFRGHVRGRGYGGNRGRGGFKQFSKHNPKKESSIKKPANAELAVEMTESSLVEPKLQNETFSQSNQAPQPTPRPAPQPAPRSREGQYHASVVVKEDLIDLDCDEEKPLEAPAAYASRKIMAKFIGTEIPSLMDALCSKIDVTLKVENCLVTAMKDDVEIIEIPDSLLDIIQFKLLYPDAVCIKS